MGIKENLEKLKSEIPKHVKLVAVSKTKPVEAIMEAYRTGHKVFGENKVQEMKEKYGQLPDDIEWHFIGHLQTNKVKYIAPFVDLIHSVDSLKVLKEIDKQAKKNNRQIKALFQFHIAEEASKFGLNWEEAEILVRQLNDFSNVKMVGVMGMATYTEDQNQIRREFRQLRSNFDKLKSKFFNNDDDFKEISMGMSGDYGIAIEEGSTIIRIGSKIFGARFKLL